MWLKSLFFLNFAAREQFLLRKLASELHKATDPCRKWSLIINLFIKEIHSFRKKLKTSQLQIFK